LGTGSFGLTPKGFAPEKKVWPGDHKRKDNRKMNRLPIKSRRWSAPAKGENEGGGVRENSQKKGNISKVKESGLTQLGQGPRYFGVLKKNLGNPRAIQEKGGTKDKWGVTGVEEKRV